jgi:hypothetical protein
VAGGWVGAAPETACGSSKRRRPLELRLLRAPSVEKEKGSKVGSGKGLGRCRSGCGSERAWELHDGGKGYGSGTGARHVAGRDRSACSKETGAKETRRLVP